ncbi:MAG TPA: hypothetical protein VE962_02600, partial [Actinomycetota bacterium]|nr:hypothetical protein [Actinomycetota bacterium]
AGAFASDSAGAVTAWAAAEGFRRRRRRRLRDAGFEPSADCSAAVGSAACSATVSGPVAAPSSAAFGFDERRRDLVRVRA